MQSHRYHFESLFDAYLTGDEKASAQLVMHIEQQELIQPEIDLLLTRLNSEINRSDLVYNANALALAGLLYLRGHYVSKDTDYAYTLLTCAEALGNAHATSHLGIYYKNVRNDFKTALAQYEKAIALGDTWAMLNRAHHHRGAFGDGDTVDFPAAIRLLESAMRMDNPCAITYRGIMLEDGQGSEVNEENEKAAFTLYEKAASLGNHVAINNLGHMHQQGKGVPRDYDKAIECYDHAISLNVPHAMSNRIIMFLGEQGCKRNDVKCAQLSRRAIKLDSPYYKDINNFNWVMDQLKTNQDLHVQYQLILRHKINEKMPSEFIKFFNDNPEEMRLLLLNDNLLDEQEKKIALDFLGQHYLDQVIQQLKLIMLGKAAYDNAFLSIVDKIPDASAQYIEALMLHADYLVNALFEEMIELQNIPDTLQVILNLHQQLLERDCRALEDKANIIENELMRMTLSTEDETEKQKKQSQLKQIEMMRNQIDDVRSGQGPMRNCINNIQSTYWTNDRDHAEFKKHIQLHASFRLLMEDYITQIQPTVASIQDRLNQCLEKCKSGLWHNVPLNLTLLQRDLKLALSSSDANPNNQLQYMSSICNRLTTGIKASRHEEAVFCKEAIALLPVLKTKKNHVMNNTSQV